jgi:uncharacterized protein (DUF983 family)
VPADNVSSWRTRISGRFTAAVDYGEAMKVTRVQIVARGLTNRCPNCGSRTLFKSGTLFELNKQCSSCGFRFERDNDEGFFLGSLSLNYGVTLVCFLVPVMLLAFFKAISATTATVLAVAGAVLVPALLYRPSRSWWFMNYYLLFPHHLPANGGTGQAGQDNNI